MLRSGGKLEFFYVDPDSAFAASRERQLKGKLASFKAMVLDNLNVPARLHGRLGNDQVSIREFSDLYPAQVFMVDEEISYAIFWADEHARNSVYFCTSDTHSPSYRRLEEHYQYYLANSRRITDPGARIGELKRSPLTAVAAAPA